MGLAAVRCPSMASLSQHQSVMELSRYWKEVPALLRLDFASTTHHPSPGLAPLGGLPPLTQESVLVKELLSILLGYSGDYIYAKPLDSPSSQRTFCFDESIDSCYKQTLEELLPCAVCYSTIARFVDDGMEYGKGSVVHALAHALRVFIKDYRNFLVELDDAYRDGQLTLLRLFDRMMPLMPALEVLADVAQKIRDGAVRGGAVLTVLYDILRRNSPSKKIEQMLMGILKMTSVPFLTMLSQWMYEGTFEDAHKEFMIGIGRQSKVKDVERTIHSYHYWEKRYRLAHVMTPEFLKDFADKILRSGKYLNIIHQYNKLAQVPGVHVMEAPVLEFEMDIRYFELEIEKAYLLTSGRLLRLMMDQENLLSKLRTMKHFFLLEVDDFMAEFLKYAGTELAQNMTLVNKPFVFSVFDDSVRSSALLYDPNRTMIKPVFQKTDIMKPHKLDRSQIEESITGSSSSGSVGIGPGIDSFTMDCVVKFPFCLVVNDEARLTYQVLFKLLFRLKVVEWKLERVRTIYTTNLSNQSQQYCFPFLQHMLNFVNSLQQYFCTEVIEPYWHDMVVKIREAKTFDEVVHEHNEFLASCTRDCFLGLPDILTLLYKLLDNCLHCSAVLADYSDGNFEADAMDIMRAKFTDKMVSLLEQLGDTRQNREFEYKLIGALHRLDFNDYYSAKLRERVLERSRTGGRSMASGSSSSRQESHQSRS